MADDGMLINFAIPETVAVAPTKFKGGAWKERMRLKKNAKNRGSGDSTAAKIEGRDAAYQRAIRDKKISLDVTDQDHRPAKRRKENGDFETSSIERQPGGPNSRIQDKTKRPTSNREVISSLFTYNPTPQVVESNQPAEDGVETVVKPSNAPLPDGIDTFMSLGLSSTLSAHLLTKMNLKTPTAIQKSAVSQLTKEDVDAFLQSETGSGKTLAYLLPIVQRIMSMAEQERSAADGVVSRQSGLFAIVLAPTRELCKQISVVLEKLLGCAHYIVAGTVVGGEKKKSEKARLRKGLNVLVATPGRLVDHLENTEVLDVSQVRYLVLDEGDRLMDLGFEEDITKIVKSLDSKKRKSTKTGLPERRITMLCSATLKTNVQKLGEISLKDALLIKGDVDEAAADPDTEALGGNKNAAFLAPAQLKQSYLVVAAKLRLVTLTALLRRTFARKGSVMKAIIFVSCADSVEFHYKVLTRDTDTDVDADADADADAGSASPGDGDENSGKVADSLQDAVSQAPLISASGNSISLYKLHGSLPQASRTAIVKAFGAATKPSLLIATDVASRGLDLPNLDLVIEYDPAFSTDDHLHRIGRTARLGRDGRAIVFLLPGKEEGYVDVLKQSYRTSEIGGASNVTSQTAEDVLKKGFSPTSGVVTKAKAWEQKATDFQLEVERWILSDPNHKELAKRAFQSHIRAYATHIAAERKWFDIKELHLGHLAKAFGLRDPPGKVNVQGLRNGRKPQANEARKRAGGVSGDGARESKSVDLAAVAADVKTARGRGAEIDEIGNAQDHAKRMRELVRNRKRMTGAGADEFNLA